MGGGRRWYWFPLVLLGFGLLVLLGWDSISDSQDYGWFAYAPATDENQLSLHSTVVVQRFEAQRYPMRDSGWAAVIVVVLVATTAWYAWRARENLRVHVTVAIAGVVGVVVCYLFAAVADASADAGVVTSVGLPLFGLGVMAGVWAYLRPGRARWLAATLATGCLAVAIGTALGVWAPGLVDPVLITGGLLVLARVERSRLLVAVAGVVLAAMVVFSTGTLSMLLPATLLLLAGVVALVRSHNPVPS